MSVIAFSSIVLSTIIGAAAPSTTPPTQVVVEVDQQGPGTGNFSFTVPIDGSVAAYVEQPDGARQRCEVAVHQDAKGLQIDLECKGRETDSLHVRARRQLRRGKRTKVAEVDPPGTDRQRVFVTLR